jgi:hypothetical protein
MMGIKLLVVAIGIQERESVEGGDGCGEAGLCGTDQIPTTSMRPQSFLLPYNHT